MRRGAKPKEERAALLKAEAVREAKFVANYSVYANGTRAVKFAGYETDFPAQYAREVLLRPHVQAAIIERQRELGELHFNLANELIADLKSMNDALQDITRIYNANGDLIDPQEWPDDLKACIAGIEIEERMEGEGDDVAMIRTKKVKFLSKLNTMALLAKLGGAMVERTQQLDAQGNVIAPAAVRPIIHVTVGALPGQPVAIEHNLNGHDRLEVKR